jgi:NADPH-dependent curcumin reductase CurA
MVRNQAFVFKAVPEGWPEKGKHLDVTASEFDLDAPLTEGRLITQNIYATFDPSQRGRMRDPSLPTYIKAFEPGQPVVSIHVISKVLKSDNARFKPGDLIMMDLWATEEYSCVPRERSDTARLLSPTPGVPMTAFLGSLGMTGLTAYGSLMEFGLLKKGETILVSAAAGAVGQIVGQVALKAGLTVIGSVGDDTKAEFITKELGFHHAFNYKKESGKDALSRLAPGGLDIYYDNVGGELLDAAIAHMKEFGRIGPSQISRLRNGKKIMHANLLLVACGAVSQYNNGGAAPHGVANTSMIARKRIRWQGFLVFDENIRKHTSERDRKFCDWIASGELKSVDYVTKGMENAVEGFLGMLKGANVGKSILQISEV